MTDHQFNAAPSQFELSNNDHYSAFSADPHTQGYPMSNPFGMDIDIYNDQFISTFDSDHNGAHMPWDYTVQFPTPVDVTPALSMTQSAPADTSMNSIPPMPTFPVPTTAHTASHITEGQPALLEEMVSQAPQEVTLPPVPAPGNPPPPPSHFCSCRE